MWIMIVAIAAPVFLFTVLLFLIWYFCCFNSNNISLKIRDDNTIQNIRSDMLTNHERRFSISQRCIERVVSKELGLITNINSELYENNTNNRTIDSQIVEQVINNNTIYKTPYLYNKNGLKNMKSTLLSTPLPTINSITYINESIESNSEIESLNDNSIISDNNSKNFGTISDFSSTSSIISSIIQKTISDFSSDEA